LDDRRRRQVRQQLREMMLRINSVPLTRVGQARKDRRGLAVAFVADE
jgi:hypothetical protein